jgi:glycosyltransferase involved in cell wall biosynthesis
MKDAKDLPIQFLGFLNNASLKFRQYLSAADVFVLPSIKEAQPQAVLEALVMGIPVIASDVGGLGDMMTDEVGCVVQPGDVESLKEKICYLYDNPEIVERLRGNCRSYIERNFTWSSIAQRYIELFKRCIT